MKTLKMMPIAVFVALALAFAPAYAFALEGGQGESGGLAVAELSTQDSDLIASGVSNSCTWSIDKNGKLVVEPTEGDVGVMGTWDKAKWDKVDDETYAIVSGVPWWANRKDIKSVEFKKTVKLQTCSGLFAGCSIETMSFTGMDTSAVTDMGYMFAASGITSLSFSGIDTSNVTDMGHMFESCEQLASLRFANVITSKTANMSCMFQNCKNLTILDLSGLNTSGATDMSYMFDWCSSLIDLDVSRFNTSNVVNMDEMFNNCYLKDKALSLLNFDTSNVTNMRLMFAHSSLASLDISSFNTSKATNMTGMFLNCYYMVHLKTGEGWSTGGADNPKPVFMDAMYNEEGIEYAAASKVPDGAHVYTKVGYEAPKPEIAKTSLAGATVAAPAQVYTGRALTPAPTVTLGGKVLTAGTDYDVSGYANNVGAGTATLTVVGKGAYEGAASGTFTISPAPIAAAKVVAPAKTYTGKQLKPAVTVTLGGKRLAAGTDYTVAYRNNTKAGTAAVTVTGKGNYSGTAKGSFKIAKAANPMKAKAVSKSVRAKDLKGKAVSVAGAVAFTKKPAGKVAYARVAKGSSARLAINAKTGKVTVKKGTKKGTYRMKVKVTAKGNANYKAKSQTLTLTVKVKQA